MPSSRLLFEPRCLEGIEVVAAADVDDGLAPVLQLLEVPHQVVGGRERDVRAVAQLGGPLRRLHPLDDVLGRQAAAGDALDRRLEHLPVVGQLLRNRRSAGADDAEHVAFVDQVAQHLLDQVARARRAPEVEVQVVDEDQEDAARRVVGRPRCGRMMPSCAGAGGGACTLNTRPPCVSTSETMSCLTPSS